MPAFLTDALQWIWHERTKIVALLLVLVLVAPQPARGQFFIDWAAIVAAINGIGTAINNVIGSGLQAINSALGAVNNVLNTINSFFQNQIYPQAAINRARGVVGAVQSVYKAIRALDGKRAIVVGPGASAANAAYGSSVMCANGGATSSAARSASKTTRTSTPPARGCLSKTVAAIPARAKS